MSIVHRHLAVECAFHLPFRLVLYSLRCDQGDVYFSPYHSYILAVTMYSQLSLQTPPPPDALSACASGRDPCIFLA